MSPHRVHWHRSAEKFVGKRADLARRQDSIEAMLAEDPYPRAGNDVISHLKGAWFCNYRLRVLGYRLLYEIYPEAQTVFVFDANVRGDVY